MKIIDVTDNKITVEFSQEEWHRINEKVSIRIAGNSPTGGWVLRINNKIVKSKIPENTESTASALINRK